MKTLLAAAILALSALSVLAQDGITVCHTPVTEKFALLASNKEFNANHPAPLPYIHQSEAGKMIKLKTADGVDANAYFLEAPQKSTHWIFVFQEWWGLNDHIKKEAEKYFTELGTVNVIALDMYDGKVATDAGSAGRYMQEFKQERGTTIVNAALSFAGKDAKVASVGWCFGGGQSMQAALTAGKQAVACVIYYGMPEENVDRLKQLNCDVLGIFGSKDKWISPAVAEKFQANMKQAGKKVTVKMYDADHAFANPSNPQFNKAYTADAHAATISFFKANLK